jgi:hypothetical protein
MTEGEELHHLRTVNNIRKTILNSRELMHAD